MKEFWPRLSADEAAALIRHDEMVAFSGFTAPVRLKRYPLRLPGARVSYIRHSNLFRFAF